MRSLILLLLLAVVPVSVPPIVVIPPTTLHAEMLFYIPTVTRPSKKDEAVQLMLTYPKEAIEAIHEFDASVCQDDSDAYDAAAAPLLRRCTGAI